MMTNIQFKSSREDIKRVLPFVSMCHKCVQKGCHNRLTGLSLVFCIDNLLYDNTMLPNLLGRSYQFGRNCGFEVSLIVENKYCYNCNTIRSYLISSTPMYTTDYMDEDEMMFSVYGNSWYFDLSFDPNDVDNKRPQDIDYEMDEYDEMEMEYHIKQYGY